MKDGLKYIVGKQIAAVVVAKSKRPPRHQVFLVFPDGSHFEFWGENFSCCSGLDKAEGIEGYVESGGGEIVRVYDEDLNPAVPACSPLTTGGEVTPCHVAAPETLEVLLTRDLKAWTEAKAVIARVKGS